MSIRQESVAEAFHNVTPKGKKKGDTYTWEDLEPYMDTLIRLANIDKEGIISTMEERGEKVPATLRTPITASEIENYAMRFDYWISLHDN